MGLLSRSTLAIFLLAFACLTHAQLINTDSTQTSFNPSASAHSQHEQDVVSHLVARLRQCIDQSPPEHGMLVQIKDLSGKGTGDVDDDTELERRRFYESIAKGWESMPFDQRLGVVSTVASTIAVPLYLMNSGVSFNEYEIGNVKDQLVAQASGNKTHHHAPYALPPPPPMVAPTTTSSKHAKRSIVRRLISLVKRDPPKPEGHEREVPEKIKSEEEEEADGKGEKKESNATVARLVAMLGAANSLLYIPAALVTAVRTVLVRDSDTATYKRSLGEDHMKGFTVTCHPVQKVGDHDYQIPARAPIYKTHYKRAVLPVHPKEEEVTPAIEAKASQTLEAEKLNETLENIHRNETLSEMEHEQKEKKDRAQEQQDVPLQRRAPQNELPKNNGGGGGGAHGPEGGPSGGPGRAQPPYSGPIREESIKHVFYVDDKHLPSAKNPRAGSMSMMKKGMIALGGAALGYGVMNMYQAAQAPPPNAQGQQMSPQYAQMMALNQRLAPQYGQQYPQMASRGAAAKSSLYYDAYDPYYDDTDDYGDLDDDIYAAALAAALDKKAAAGKAATTSTPVAAVTPTAPTVAISEPAVIPAVAPPAAPATAQVASPAVVAAAPAAPVVAAPVASVETPVNQVAPTSTAGGNSTDTAPTRRSVYTDLSSELLFKRNPPPERRPGGPEVDPFLVKTQYEIQHHNTPYDQIPGYELGYGKKREPAGPPGSPEQLAQEEQERKEEEALAKAQKTFWAKIAAIGAGGAVIGALYKTFWGSPAPQQQAAVQQGYYGDQDGYYYKKRELIDEKDTYMFKRSPETYDEIIRSLKDEAAREASRRARKMDRIEYDSDANGQHFAVNKSKSTPVPSYHDDDDEEEVDDDGEYLYRRGNSDLQYDADATGQHFSVTQRDRKECKVGREEEEAELSFNDDEDDEDDDDDDENGGENDDDKEVLRRRGNPSIEYDGSGDSQHFAVYQSQGDEESWQRREDSSIVYDDTGDAQHFSAIIPEASTLEGDMVADGNMELSNDSKDMHEEVNLKRRENSKIEYDVDGHKQHFRVKKGDVDEKDTVLERRRDTSISLDSDPSGSHFRAILPSSTSNKSDDQVMQRRHQDDTVDYHAGKNHDVTFTAHAHLEPHSEKDEASGEIDEDDENDEDFFKELEIFENDSGDEEDIEEDIQRRGEASISLDTSKDGSSHFEATIPADDEESVEDESVDLSRREEADVTYHSDEEHGTDFHASTSHPQQEKEEKVEKSLNVNTRYGRNGVVTIEIAPQDDCDSQEMSCKRPCFAPDR